MTPDIPGADASGFWQNVGTGLGLVLAGVLAAFGAHRGEKDRKTTPAATPESAGVTFSLIERQTQVGIAADTKRTADGVDALVEMVSDWIKSDDARRAKAEREEIKDKVETLDEKIDRLTRLIDDRGRRD